MSLSKSDIPEPARNDSRPTAVGDAMFAVCAVALRPAISWVSAAGKLTGEDAATRLATVLQQQRDTGHHLVRLDLSELSMLDGAGFDVLVDAHDQFLAAGGALVLTGVGGRIARLLQITGLDQTLFTIAPGEQRLPGTFGPDMNDSPERARSGYDHTT